VLYVILSLVMRAGFWGLGLVLFPRRRRLGTPL
jgi:polar amino acid transport system permease protein